MLTDGIQSESVKKRKWWFKETTEWSKDGISVYQVADSQFKWIHSLESEQKYGMKCLYLEENFQNMPLRGK